MRPIFNVVRPDDPEREITQRDQFNTDEVTLAETLVRESLQNSNDARLKKDSLVRVRINIIDPKPEHSGFWKPLLGQLEPHLIAAGLDLEGIDLGLPRILTVEDFGTTGLTGSPDKKDNSNFQDFWRRVGQSHKGAEKAGSWGLGKIVFPASSRIRTFFGLTIRHDDPNKTPLLMGQTLLRYHDIGDKRYDPLGLIADEGSDGFRIPARDVSMISNFVAATGFTRTTEPGLSIAIPFVGDELSATGLIPFVVRNYFFPIITGQLEVEIGGELITAANFDAFAAAHAGAVLGDGGLISFIRDVNTQMNAAPSLTLPPSWSPQSIEDAIGAADLKALRERYSTGELVHVRAPMSMTRKGSSPETGSFDLFLRLSDSGKPATSLFVRGSITVPGESQYFPSRQAFGALISTSGVVSQFLRDAENPAHTRWNGQADRLNERWRNPAQRLSQIRNSLRALHEALAQEADRVEQDALRDILSVRRSGSETTHTKRSPVVLPPRVPPLTPAPRMFNLSKVTGGFVVKAGAGLAPETMPLQIRVRVGYDIARGDPLKKHSPLDFDLTKSGGDIAVTGTGASCAAPNANELLIEATDLGFEVKVVGFDTHRDLKVKAVRVLP